MRELIVIEISVNDLLGDSILLRMVWRRNMWVTCGKCRMKGESDKCLTIKKKRVTSVLRTKEIFMA